MDVINEPETLRTIILTLLGVVPAWFDFFDRLYIFLGFQDELQNAAQVSYMIDTGVPERFCEDLETDTRRSVYGS